MKEIVRMAMNQPDGLMDLSYGDTIDNYDGEEVPIESLYDLNKSEFFDDYVNEDDVNKMIDKYINYDDDTNPKRSKVISNTYEDTVNINDDKRLYCEHCNEDFFGHCPKHESVLVLDNPLPRTVTYRASLSNPYPLQVKESKGRFGGMGVFTTENLPCCLVFGPYQGIFSDMSESKVDSGYGWHIKTFDMEGLWVDAVDTSVSNWMRYVKCATYNKEINLAVYQYNGNIYYRTISTIPRGTELMVWYGDDFGKELGLAPVTPKVVNHISSNESSSCHHSFKHDFTSSNVGKFNKLIISKLRNEKSVFRSKNVESLTKSFKNQASNNESINYDDLNVDKENSSHLKKDTGVKLKCSYCDFETIQSGYLKEHERKHTGNKLECNFCDFKTFHSRALIRHVKIHTGVKLKCSYCDYETIYSSTLKRHMNIHTGVKLKCSYCDFETARSDNLKVHERKHIGNMLKCNHCDFETIYSSSLKQHENIHTGVKLKCSYCDFKTIWSSNLKIHERKHTGNMLKGYHCDYETIYSS